LISADEAWASAKRAFSVAPSAITGALLITSPQGTSFNGVIHPIGVWVSACPWDRGRSDDLQAQAPDHARGDGQNQQALG